MDKNECYRILGIKVDSSQDDIKSAYRLLAKKWHPDINKEPHAAEEFKKVQKAYDILINSNNKNTAYADINSNFTGFNINLNEIFQNIMKNDFYSNINYHKQTTNMKKCTILELEFDSLKEDDTKKIRETLKEKGYNVILRSIIKL